MKLLNIIFLFIVLTTTSCLNEDTFKKEIAMPSTKPNVVVFGYLSPSDDSIRIYVSKSNTINEPAAYSEYKITDAQVKLTCESKQVIVPWSEYSFKSGDYIGEEYIPGTSYPGAYKIATKDFPLVAGKTINIEVVTSFGTVTSSCVIPEESAVEPELQKLWINSNNSNGSELIANVLFKNFEQNNGYYRVQAVVREIYSGVNSYSYDLPFDIVIGSEFQIHKPTDANQLNCRFVKSYYYNDERQSGDSICVGVIHSDEPYYKFQTSYAMYQNGNDNPFAEPTIIYSNINGGLGVFAAYRKKVFAFAVKDYLEGIAK